MKVHVSIEDTPNLDDLYEEFPCLMRCKHSSIIVLFTDRQTGTVVSSSSSKNVGLHTTSWEISDFELLPESYVIKLQNKRELTEEGE